MSQNNRARMSAIAVLSSFANPRRFSSTGVPDRQRFTTDSYPIQSRANRCFTQFLLAVCFFLTLAQPAWADLPAGWADADIGSPGLAGSAGYTNGNWTVTGGGTDIYGTADQFNYAYVTVNGDGTLIADVTSLQKSDPTNRLFQGRSYVSQ